MASSSLANFFSLFKPAKAPPPSPKLAPPPPSNLSVLSSENKDGFLAAPLISSGMAPHSPITLSSSSSSSSYSNCSNDLTSVVCPSLAYANTLYYKHGYNVQVVVEEDEPQESAVERFRRECMRAGIIQEAKRRRFHENSQEKVKRKTKEAARRNRRRRTFPPRGDEVETPVERDDDEEGGDDNWDM